MEVIFNFMENNQSPNWFDWLSLGLSLVVSVLSIGVAYWLGEREHRKEREKEDRNIASEKELFESHLHMLNDEIEEQIKDLKKYVDERGFRIKVNPKIQIDFLQYIDLKSIYEENKREKINNLLSALYSLSHFYTLLQNEVENFNTYFNKEEKIFQENYRDVFYAQLNILNNKRAEEFKQENGQILFKYNEGDNFMREYMGIANLFEQNVRGIDGVADRIKISEELVKIAKVAHKYIPYDYDAIMINTIANKAHSAYINMENRRKHHFEIINTFLETLENVNKEIEKYSRR